MPALAAIIEAILAVFPFIVRAFTLIRSFFVGLSKLVASYWPKVIAALPAIVAFFIDHILEAFFKWTEEVFNDLADKADSAQTLPFPSIPTLASAYYAVDPELLQWMEAFRVSESVSVIASVAAWKYGKDIVARIIGKIS